MNSKIIAAGAVVALCAVALIGVGYAYTATFDNVDNKISSDAQYIVISKESTAISNSTVVVEKANFVIPFNTETKKGESGYVIEYTPDITNGVNNWSQNGETTQYTKTISKTVKITVNTGEAASKTGSFNLVVTPSTITPPEGSYISSITASVSKINGSVVTAGSGSFTGTGVDQEISIDIDLIVVVNKVSQQVVPVELNNLAFDVRYQITPGSS